MTDTCRDILRAVACLIAGISLGLIFAEKRHRQDPDILVQRDTIVTRDTVEIERPVPVTTYVRTTDTIRIMTTEYVTVNDTVCIMVPRTVKEYKGDNYDATVSGYDPVLERIAVYPETVYITSEYHRPAKANRWGLSGFVGCGLSGDFKPLPVMGIGITYDLIQF